MKLATLVVVLSYVPGSISIRHQEPLGWLIGAGGLILLLALAFIAFGRGARNEHEHEQRRRNRP